MTGLVQAAPLWPAGVPRRRLLKLATLLVNRNDERPRTEADYRSLNFTTMIDATSSSVTRLAATITMSWRRNP